MCKARVSPYVISLKPLPLPRGPYVRLPLVIPRNAINSRTYIPYTYICRACQVGLHVGGQGSGQCGEGGDARCRDKGPLICFPYRPFPFLPSLLFPSLAPLSIHYYLEYFWLTRPNLFSPEHSGCKDIIN